MRGQWGLIFMYARADPYKLNWVENATACSLYWSECSHQRCNHICPGMLWEPAVPSCLLNNYGSILGPDNIDPPRCHVTLHRDAWCSAKLHARDLVQTGNHTLTLACQLHAANSPVRFRSGVGGPVFFLFRFRIKPFQRFRNERKLCSSFFFLTQRTAVNKPR